MLTKFGLAVPVISLSLKVREYHHQMLISQEIVFIVVACVTCHQGRGIEAKRVVMQKSDQV